MTADIRNKEITIKVRTEECATDAIDRYMKRQGFKKEEWIDGKDLRHSFWHNAQYQELVLAGYNVWGNNDDKVTFQIANG